MDIVDAAGPFGVFVRNTTANDILGCSLKWELTSSDGTVKSFQQTYSNPGALIGLKPLDPNMIGRTSLINASSTRFLSLHPSLKAIFEARESQRYSPEISDKDRQALSRIKAVYDKQLKTTVSITVSLDGVVFDDGEFIGPDTTKFLTRLQAFVNAKRDIATFVRSGVNEGKRPSEILAALDSKLTASRKLSKTGDSEYDRIYEGYFRNLTTELQEVKKRGDEKATTYAQDGLDRYKQLHKRDK